MDNKYILVRCDDWEGLYKNGELLDEGHDIDLAKHLGIERVYVNQEWVEEKVNFPNKLSDIPEEVIERG